MQLNGTDAELPVNKKSLTGIKGKGWDLNAQLRTECKRANAHTHRFKGTTECQASRAYYKFTYSVLDLSAMASDLRQWEVGTENKWDLDRELRWGDRKDHNPNNIQNGFSTLLNPLLQKKKSFLNWEIWSKRWPNLNDWLTRKSYLMSMRPGTEVQVLPSVTLGRTASKNRIATVRCHTNCLATSTCTAEAYWENTATPYKTYRCK